MQVRPPAVAGSFYPGDPKTLQQMLEALLREAKPRPVNPESIRALVVPHAGYVYSGPVAAIAYRLLQHFARRVKRVVLLGPSHRVYLDGIALPTTQSFDTPLGNIPLDLKSLEEIGTLPGIQFRDDAHAQEHSLEVQLPFLQQVLGEFSLVPLVVGAADVDTIEAVIANFWDQPETVIVVSSDLSHFHSYTDAQNIDWNTTQRIERLDHTIIGEEACGCYPLNGLLKLVKRKGLSVDTLDVRNSGDTAGTKDRVVGYGSYVVH